MRIVLFQIYAVSALLFLGWDIYDAVVKGGFDLAPLGQRWFEIDQLFSTASLNLTQAVIQRFVWDELWTLLFQPILLAPAVMVPIGLALVTLVLLPLLKILR